MVCVVTTKTLLLSPQGVSANSMCSPPVLSAKTLFTTAREIGPVGVMRIHDCLSIGTIPNHVHRYTLVYCWSDENTRLFIHRDNPQSRAPVHTCNSNRAGGRLVSSKTTSLLHRYILITKFVHSACAPVHIFPIFTTAYEKSSSKTIVHHTQQMQRSLCAPIVAGGGLQSKHII